jgi:hypothetical protein
MAIRHTQRRNVYHVDQRSGFVEPLGEMSWDNGVLTKQVDTAIIGSRDMKVVRAISIDRHELTPDRKLTEPTARTQTQHEILY